MSRRNLILWVLYDFANSILNINLVLYFSQWLVIEKGIPDLYYGAVFSASTMLLILTSPILGVYTEQLSKRLPILAGVTGLISISAILLGLVAVYGFGAQQIVFAFLFYFIMMYFYQASFVFYNSLIPSLSPAEKYGATTGLGEFGNNLGLIVGLLITLPIVNLYGRAHTFLPAGLLFMVCVLPFFIGFKEKARQKVDGLSMGMMTKRTVQLIKNLPKERNMLFFLVGFYFVSDAVRTLILFFPIYTENILKISDYQKALLSILLASTMMFGGLIGGNMADKKSHKKVLLVSVFIMILCELFIIPLSSVNALAIFLLVFLGLSWGSYFAVAKALLVRLSPTDQVGEYFGLFTLFEKFASVLAPLIWGGTVLAFSAQGIEVSYRMAAFVTVLLVVVGGFFFRKISFKAA